VVLKRKGKNLLQPKGGRATIFGKIKADAEKKGKGESAISQKGGKGGKISGWLNVRHWGEKKRRGDLLKFKAKKERRENSPRLRATEEKRKIGPGEKM